MKKLNKLSNQKSSSEEDWIGGFEEDKSTPDGVFNDKFEMNAKAVEYDQAELNRKQANFAELYEKQILDGILPLTEGVIPDQHISNHTLSARQVQDAIAHERELLARRQMGIPEPRTLHVDRYKNFEDMVDLDGRQIMQVMLDTTKHYTPEDILDAVRELKDDFLHHVGRNPVDVVSE